MIGSHKGYCSGAGWDDDHYRISRLCIEMQYGRFSPKVMLLVIQTQADNGKYLYNIKIFQLFSIKP